MHIVHIVHQDGSATTFRTETLVDTLKRVLSIARRDPTLAITIVYVEGSDGSS